MEVIVPVEIPTESISNFSARYGAINWASTDLETTVSASSTNAGYSAVNAIKGVDFVRNINKTETCWQATGATGTYTLTFNRAKKITRFVLVSPQNPLIEPAINPAQNPFLSTFRYGIDQFSVEGFISGVWTSLLTSSMSGAIVELTPNWAEMTAIRVNILSMKGGANAAIGMLQTFGEEDTWVSTTTYPVNYPVKFGSSTYFSLQGTNLGKDPTSTSSILWWQRRGPINQLAVFDKTLGIGCNSDGVSIVYELRTPHLVFNAVALLQPIGASASVTVFDRTTVYNNTTNALVSGPFTTVKTSQFELVNNKGDTIVFKNLGFQGDRIDYSGPDRIENREYIEITVAVIPNTRGSIGEIVCGILYDLGFSEYGASAGIVDYSVKSTDPYGNTLLLPRNFAKTMQIAAKLPKVQTSDIQAVLYGLRARPAVWIASYDTNYNQPLIIYGFYKNFTAKIDYPTFTQLNFEIEGLT